ncbi:IclR family transcriptional regulator [Enterovirga aerilata]|nr:IclR family transcriptional regulator [Enterovirga sp. DB1703]
MNARKTSSSTPTAKPPTRERAVPAVTRAAAILRILARSESPLGVQAIARELKLVPSTCLHILRALVAEELVAFDPDTKRYRLDVGILSLARHLLKKGGFADYIQDRLQDLSQRLGVTAVGLEVRGLDHVVVVSISRAREPFHIHVDVGSRFPSLISASGRCIAAFGGYDEAELRERFSRLRWDRPPSFEQWRQEVEDARANGFGVDIDQYILGVTVISAPIFLGGRLSHALVVVGLTERLRSNVRSIGQDIVRIANEISHQMNT